MRLSVCLLSLAAVILFGQVAAAAPCPTGMATSKTYAVKIDSAPPGATVYVNDKNCAVGTTPWSGRLANGDNNLIIELAGYEPAMKTMKVVRSRKLQELFVPLVKKAEPPKIDVKADADPKGVGGAQVFLDGEMKGVAPITLTTTPGRHQLVLKKDGYETTEQWITTAENQTQTILPTLKEIAKPKYGSIVVEADVPDAEVYIDGNKHPDNTPAVINNVIEGLHVIEVRKAPSLPWKQTVQVTANNATKVRADMQSTMNGGTGVVRVISDAPGARAFIDGTDMGPVPVDIKDVKAGDHIIQVKAPGMKTGERTVTVAAGKSTIEKFDLNTETPADVGTLKVVSMRPDALVFIDGAAAGKVPVDQKIAAGEHLVTVRLQNFKDFEQKVRVEAGQVATVTAQLQKVGRLKVLSTPIGADVFVNGKPIGKTPLDQEVEVGEAIIRIEAPGFQPYQETITISGGEDNKPIAPELAIAGKSEAELASEQRSLSSFGARTLPRGRSTTDVSAGYPYYLNARINVGAGKIANQFGFDAGVGVRSMFARNELGLGGRMMLADAEPFSAGVFTDIWWGSKLLDDSGRNGFTWDAGAVASLTALSHVTISGRLYFNIWSDRHCPELKSGSSREFDGDPVSVCEDYVNNRLSSDEKKRINRLTTGDENEDWEPQNRENGIRLMASVIAEVALEQRWSIFGILEGAPFQEERALFTYDFAHSMADRDFNLYLRLGATYKF